MDSRPGSLLVTMGMALAAMLLAGLLLVAGYSLLLDPRFDVESGSGEHGGNAQRRVIPGRELQLVVGNGVRRGDALAVTGFVRGSIDKRAIAVWQGRVTTGDFMRLRVDIVAGHPDTGFQVFWRTAAEPDNMRVSALLAVDGRARVSLMDEPGWTGEVVELGVLLVAHPAEDSLSIQSLTLQPYTRWGLLRGRVQDWLVFRGWSQWSINQLHGTPDKLGLSPVVAVAACSGVSIILLGLFGAVTGRRQLGAVVVVVLTAWVVLDLLWQSQLSRQLQRTGEQFAGKSQRERHLADEDSELFQYVEDIRPLLPERPARILILKDDHGHDYERLKIQFYLLPHNSYNFGVIPPPLYQSYFDYVLVLEPRLVKYQEEHSRLDWGGRLSLPVTLLHHSERGDLFRVRHDERFESGGAPR